MPRSPEDISDATLRLLLAPGLGPVTLSRLRERFSGDEAIVAASPAELEAIKGIGAETASALCDAVRHADPDSERRAMRDHHVSLILHGDADFPAMLAPIPNAPLALWVRGSLTDEDRLAIAIVGSRKCTSYGRDQAARFSSLLAQTGLTIVSGGALGIDGEAHRAAMRVGGRTIVVAGCGLGKSYPPEHDMLFTQIAEGGSGAIISEFPMDTPPAAGNFPRRNRIISGLSLGVLVIEAALRSGALITARLASGEHNREAMALPGRVDSPASAGCLKAIREGWAALVTNHADVIEQLDASDHIVRGALETAGIEAATTKPTLFDGNLTAAQQSIVSALTDSNDGLLLDQLAARTQLPLSQIMADLTLLQIRGRVTKDWNGAVRLKR